MSQTSSRDRGAVQTPVGGISAKRRWRAALSLARVGMPADARAPLIIFTLRGVAGILRRVRRTSGRISTGRTPAGPNRKECYR